MTKRPTALLIVGSVNHLVNILSCPAKDYKSKTLGKCSHWPQNMTQPPCKCKWSVLRGWCYHTWRTSQAHCCIPSSLPSVQIGLWKMQSTLSWTTFWGTTQGPMHESFSWTSAQHVIQSFLHNSASSPFQHPPATGSKTSSPTESSRWNWGKSHTTPAPLAPRSACLPPFFSTTTKVIALLGTNLSISWNLPMTTQSSSSFGMVMSPHTGRKWTSCPYGSDTNTWN